MIKTATSHYQPWEFNNPLIHAKHEKLKFNINFNRKVIAFDYGSNSKNFKFLNKQHRIERKIQAEIQPLSRPLSKTVVSGSGEVRLSSGYFRHTVRAIIRFNTIAATYSPETSKDSGLPHEK